MKYQEDNELARKRELKQEDMVCECCGNWNPYQILTDGLCEKCYTS